MPDKLPHWLTVTFEYTVSQYSKTKYKTQLLSIDWDNQCVLVCAYVCLTACGLLYVCLIYVLFYPRCLSMLSYTLTHTHTHCWTPNCWMSANRARETQDKTAEESTWGVSIQSTTEVAYLVLLTLNFWTVLLTWIQTRTQENGEASDVPAQEEEIKWNVEDWLVKNQRNSMELYSDYVTNWLCNTLN